MVRTNIAVDDAVADMLSQEAMRRNQTIYAFANECIESIVKVCREGGEPEQMYPSWKFNRLLKDMDAVPLPGDLLEKMIRRLSEVQKDWVLKAWFEEGSRIGSYLQIAYPQLEDLSSVVKEFEGLLPLKRIDVKKLEAEGRARFKVSAIGVGMSPESTGCAEQLLHGIISSYSGSVVGSRTTEGIIEIEVVPGRKAVTGT